MNTEIPKNFSLQSYLDSILPDIDKLLNKSNVDISHRPLHATTFFIKNFIDSIECHDKDDIDNPLFVACMNHVIRWYEEKYGSIRNSPKLNLTGLVFIHGQPFKLIFPYSISDDGENEKLLALKFPIELAEEESWMDYVVNPPNFEIMDNPTRAQVESDVGDVISTIRDIFHNCIRINIEKEEYSELAKSIPEHINSASEQVCKNSGTTINNALWNLHLASEKAFKAIQYQQSGEFEKIHDLFKLLKKTKLSNIRVIEKILETLPRGKDVINKRYEPSNFNNAFEFKDKYLSYLNMIKILSNHFENKLLAKNAVIYLKRPKYAGARLKE